MRLGEKSIFLKIFKPHIFFKTSKRATESFKRNSVLSEIIIFDLIKGISKFIFLK